MQTIVIVYDQAYISGGAGKIAIGEAVALKQKGYRVIYFSAVGEPKDGICRELIDNDIETICLHEKHIAFTFNPIALAKGIWNGKSYKSMIELLSSLDTKNTVVHIHGWTKALSSSVFLAAYKMKFHTIITLHEYFTLCQNGGIFDYRENRICRKKPGTIKCFLCNCDKRNYMQKLYRDLRQIIQNIVLKKTKPSVIYITSFSKELLKKSVIKPKKEYELTNFVEISHHKRVKVEYNDIFLFIGRVSAEKGIDNFCEAVRASNANGLVIGDGPLKDIYKEQYPEITFAGWKNTSEMNDYLQSACSLIISSKWYETMGLTVIEMQQYGIPCIVPKDCAAKEYVINERTGLLYETGNVKDLVTCIMKMKDDKRKQELSTHFYNSMDYEKFSMDSHIKSLMAIYKNELSL